MKNLTVLYFAAFRDLADCREESITSSANTARALYEEVCPRHNFPTCTASLQVAINDDFSTWDAPLQDGDTVAFLSPVAGG